MCMPFVDAKTRRNATTWWGDVEATVAYCKATVERICSEHGGDRSALFLAGFSRGAIACNGSCVEGATTPVTQVD